MDKKAHIFVSGKVQGVFFRDFIREKAQELGLTGFVRNLSDGRVEVVAEGEESSLQSLYEHSKKGPELSQVESTEIDWETPSGEFSEFTINY